MAGDIFVVDNASVHNAAEIVDQLEAALDAAHVRMIFLPTYSPELNPCELVFGQIKARLRRHRQEGAFWREILDALGTVTLANVAAYYLKCLDPAGDAL